MKAERIKSFKGNSEEEGEGFLQQMVRCDKTWGHHHDPENKRQSIEYHYKGSQAPQKSRTKDSAAKVVLTVFQNSEGVVLTDSLKKRRDSELRMLY
jgi:hypothetical protein